MRSDASQPAQQSRAMRGLKFLYWLAESLPGSLGSIPGWLESLYWWLESLPGWLEFLPGWLEFLSGWLESLPYKTQPPDNIMAASADEHHISASRDDDNLFVNIS